MATVYRSFYEAAGYSPDEIELFPFPLAARSSLWGSTMCDSGPPSFVYLIISDEDPEERRTVVLIVCSVIVRPCEVRCESVSLLSDPPILVDEESSRRDALCRRFGVCAVPAEAKKNQPCRTAKI